MASDKLNQPSIEKSRYGMTRDGIPVDEYVLSNSKDMEVKIISLGGIITSITVPDRNGQHGNVVLGFDNLESYEEEHPFFGALVGRYGNRIAKGQFKIDGNSYQLPLNNGENHLHGGPLGFDKAVWAVDDFGTDNESAYVKLSYISMDVEMGYPGKLKTVVSYVLNNNNALEIKYSATTDKPTICNLTQHSYFNLSSNFGENILDQELSIHADSVVPVDENLIPTGELMPVANSPFDFNKSKLIGDDINNDDEQLERGGGYDHCWVLNGNGLRKIASAYHPESGRVLEVLTDEPGVQLYTGNFLDSTLAIPGGGFYGKRSGFCLETQHFPDSPNQPNFPSTILRPGEEYESNTIFQFSTK